MKKKIEPWNDPKTPIQKGGVKWATVIMITVFCLIFIGMLIWAAVSAH